VTLAFDSPADTDFQLRQALHGYVYAVSEAVGSGRESCTFDFGTPAGAYIALDSRLPDHPDRDLALLWDEHRGWSAAIESRCREDLIVAAYLGGPVVPPPHAVARFVADVQAGRRRTTPPREVLLSNRELVEELQRPLSVHLGG